MKRIYIEIHYATHTYKATLITPGTLMDYLKRETKGFILGDVEGNQESIDFHHDEIRQCHELASERFEASII